MSRLNPIDLRFRHAGEPNALFARAQLRTPNGRYGGCFDVEGSIALPEGVETGSITSTELQFEQHWIYRGQGEAQGKDQSSSLALDKNTSWVEAGPETPVEDLVAPSASQSKDPPAYVESSHTGRTLRFRCSSHFPSEAVEGESGYYQTTLDFTRVAVRFRHVLSCRLRVELQGKEHEVVLEAKPTVVGVSRQAIATIESRRVSSSSSLPALAERPTDRQPCDTGVRRGGIVASFTTQHEMKLVRRIRRLGDSRK